MPGRPHRLMRHTAQLVLALVLLAPVVAAAHVHGFGAETASAACSVCTVAKHAPAVVAAGTLVAGTAPQVHVASSVLPAPARTGRCWRPAGRAPPAVSSRQPS